MRVFVNIEGRPGSAAQPTIGRVMAVRHPICWSYSHVWTDLCRRLTAYSVRRWQTLNRILYIILDINYISNSINVKFEGLVERESQSSKNFISQA